ncbi:MAG TPA: DNA polymerase III subunit delta [Blastocatellia bacterium]|nr:DNA polymerase III subunit delta [Blastocatellia bacterium]
MSKRPKTSTDGLTYESIKRQFKERRIDPLYLFIGEEQYLQEQALRLLYDTLDEAGRAFNLAVLSLGGDAGSKSTPAQVLDYANQLPMMSNRRILVVRDFEKLKEEDCESLLRYLKLPCPTSTVVFQTNSLDKRRKISQALVDAATVVTFDLLNDQAARRWAENYLKKRGCSIEPEALGHLIGLVGTPLSRLSNELDKLSTYAGDGTIGDAAIEQLVPRAREHTNWELSDAVLTRDRKRAMKLVQRLMDDGAAPLMLVGMLASLYRRMLTVKAMISRGASTEEIEKATNQRGYRAIEFNKRVGRASREEIVHGLRRLAEVDDSIKNSMGTPRLQIEYLVAELTLPAGAALRYKT